MFSPGCSWETGAVIAISLRAWLAPDVVEQRPEGLAAGTLKVSVNDDLGQDLGRVFAQFEHPVGFYHCVGSFFDGHGRVRDGEHQQEYGSDHSDPVHG